MLAVWQITSLPATRNGQAKGGCASERRAMKRSIAGTPPRALATST